MYSKTLLISVLMAACMGCTDVLVGGSGSRTNIDGINSDPGGEKTQVTDADTGTIEPETVEPETVNTESVDTGLDEEEGTETLIDSTDEDTEREEDSAVTTDTDEEMGDETDSVSVTDTEPIPESDTNSNIDSTIEECEIEDTYDQLGTVCYVDSIDGDDTNTGRTPDAPLKTQGAVGAACNVVRFKRGTSYEKLDIGLQDNNKVYTNYGDSSDPLPRFVVPSEPLSGPVVNSVINTNVTLDGLYIAGARGDGTAENLSNGICVFLGPSSTVKNCEISSCDIGAMLSGEGSVFQGNYVHDMNVGIPAESGDDPSTFGGAEGVFVNASNCEVSYNTFVNCIGQAGDIPGCDGGATEVTVTACETISGVKIHHNFSYNSCGFFEVSTYFGDCKGLFSNSEIYNNVSINSAWMGFFSVNNTDFDNIHFYNNTSLHRGGSASAGQLWIIFTGTSSGRTGGAVYPGTVFLTNNLFVFDEVIPFGELIDPAFEQTTNRVIRTDENDPGFLNIDGNTPVDFDLNGTSPAIDSGTVVTGNTLDFMNRAIPDPSGKADVGAYEYGSAQEVCLPSRMPE